MTSWCPDCPVPLTARGYTICRAAQTREPGAPCPNTKAYREWNWARLRKAAADRRQARLEMKE